MTISSKDWKSYGLDRSTRLNPNLRAGLAEANIYKQGLFDSAKSYLAERKFSSAAIIASALFVGGYAKYLFNKIENEAARRR